MTVIPSAITLRGFFSSLMLCCLSFFSTTFEEQFACSHMLLDFFTFLLIIQQWLLLDAREATGLLLFKAQPSDDPVRFQQ